MTTDKTAQSFVPIVLSEVTNPKQMMSDLSIYKTLTPQQRSVVEARLRRASASRPLIERRAHPLEPGPLSYMQRHVWLLDQLEQGNVAYNIPGGMMLTGDLDVKALTRALGEIVRRHEALRTCFQVIDGQPLQVVQPAKPVAIAFVDISEPLAQQAEAELPQIASRLADLPFDLAAGYLLRVVLVRVSDREHGLFFVVHHIVSDGWSLNILFREVSELYLAFSEGRVSPLTAPALQYADFAAWQQKWLQGDGFTKGLNYWRRKLEGAPRLLELPLDYPRPATQRFHGAHQAVALPSSTASALEQLGEKEGATLFMVLMAIFQMLLRDYSCQDDVIVGTGVANRPSPDLEDVVGFFVNTIVLRTTFPAQVTFRELLQQLRETTLDAFSHADVPLEVLLDELRVERDPGFTPLFQVMFVLQNTPQKPHASIGLQSSVIAGDHHSSKFDLCLILSRTDRGIEGTLEYNTDLFRQPTIARMVRRFELLADGLTGHMDEPVRSLLPGSSADWSHHPIGPRAPHEDRFESVVKWIGRVTEAHGQRVALRCGGREKSYADLERESNRWGNYLVEHGVRSGELVGVFSSDRMQAITGMLAVLKAGAGFVMIDPDLPEKRLSALVEQIDLRWVLKGSEDGKHGDWAKGACWLSMEGGASEAKDGRPPQRTLDPDGLAYVYFTSGSTGKPKAIAGRARGIDHFLRWEIETLSLQPGQRVSQLLPLSFDGSMRDVLLPLCFGGMVCIPKERDTVRDAAALLQWLDSEEIELMHCVPSLFRALVNESRDGSRLSKLRHLVMAGEAILPGDVRRWLAIYGERIQLWNLYGTSETTMAKLAHRVTAGDLTKRSIPIGKPIPGAEILLLDSNRNPVVAGAIGEIYLRTPYRSLGYYRQPELTAESFVPNPFSDDVKDVLYRTGDMGRELEDGAYEHLGRRDQQVKVRGVRVELGEVESILRTHPDVLDVSVVDRNDAQGYTWLCAYVVWGSKTEPASKLREFCLDWLPEALVPGRFVALSEMPRTISGKVDRRALPLPGTGAVEYEAPRTPVQQVLASLWQQQLSLARVGLQDHFFQLGGHSLMAAQVASRIRTAFQVEVPLRTLFECPTLEALANAIERAQEARDGLPPLAISRPLIERRAHPLEPGPLSYMQRHVWLLDQLEQGNVAYNIPGGMMLTGDLDVKALTRALGEIVRRHEALRTCFQVIDGQPLQVVQPAKPVAIAFVDISEPLAQQAEAELPQIASRLADLPFDLAAGYLLRVVLVRVSDREHGLFFVVHHIVSDGWSLNILFREVSELYLAFSEGRVSPLTAPALQYADFAAWQQKWLQGDGFTKGLNYWRRKLEGAPRLLELPLDYPRPATQRFHGAHQAVALPSSTASALEQLGEKEGATLFMVLMAIFQMLLRDYSCQDDVIVGTGVANRPSPDLEDVVGFFVNTIVLRTTFPAQVTFRELLQQLRETTLDAFSHADVPLEVLLDELRVERDPGFTPLFQVMFVLQNTPQKPHASIGLQSSVIAGDHHSSKFDLCLILSRTDRGIEGTLEYNTDLFRQPTIARMVRRFELLADGLTGHMDEPVRSLLPGSSADWSHHPIGPRAPHEDRFESVVKWIGRVTEAHGQRVALRCGGREKSYADLERESNRWGNYLVEHGVRSGELVGVFSSDRMQAITGMLAVLKAGAGFVMIDPDLPEKRLSALVEQIDLRWVLKGSEDGKHGDWAKGACWLSMEGGASEAKDGRPPQRTLDPDGLAYVYFTSGSTGKPKAIAGRARGIDHFLRWEIETLSLQPGQRVSQLLPLSFDGSMRDVLLPLCFGGMVCIPKERDTVRDAGALLQWLDSEEIELMHCVPSLFRAIVNESRDGSRLSKLRHIVMAGEAILPGDVQRWLAIYGERIQLWNLYGTSETTMAKLAHRVTAGDLTKRSIPIGKPIPGAEILLLDSNRNPVVAGAIGEIYLRTPYRSLGYYRQPELTAESFVPNPFSDDVKDVLYRTGDMGRELEDGAYEHLGRRDQQVKVRGVRVELGEVESILRTHHDVLDVSVVDRNDAQGYTWLCAYVVWGSRTEPVSKLREFCLDWLPEALVPGRFVALSEMPRTISGKVDRRALPLPGAGAAEYEAPRTPVQQVLASLWQQQLSLARVGLQDHFFQLGGHSLMAAQVASRIRTAFQVEVPLRTLFECPTLEALANAIESAQEAQDGLHLLAIPRTDRAVALPLSFAQQRLWFLEQLNPGQVTYNMPVALELTGELDAEVLRLAFAELVRRHETLRTHFVESNGTAWQQIEELRDFELPLVDLSGLVPELAELRARKELERESWRPFDFERGPLLRCRVWKFQAQRYWLLCNLHHIISDAWSLAVLMREVDQLYGAFRAGKPSPLAELPIQYADYAAWQRQQLQGERLQMLLSYWKLQLADCATHIELPTDGVANDRQTSRCGLLPFRIDPQIESWFRHAARENGATLFMVLLANLAVLLCRYSGQTDLVIGSPVANRGRAEIEGLIGFFVNMVPLRVQVQPGMTFAEVVRNARRTSLDAYVHQDLPFEMLLDELKLERASNGQPLFQVVLDLNFTSLASAAEGALRFSQLNTGLGQPKFDLVIHILESPDGLNGAIEYNAGLFDFETIEQMAVHFQNIAWGFSKNPTLTVDTVPLIGAVERQHLLALAGTRG